MVTVSSCAVCSYGTCTFESCIILSLTYSRVWQVIHVHWFTFHPGWSLQQKVWSPVSHTGQGGWDLWSDSSLAQFSSPWLADLWFALLPVKLESRSHSGNLQAISSHLSVGGYSGYGLTKQSFSKPCFLLLPVQIGTWGCADLARRSFRNPHSMLSAVFLGFLFSYTLSLCSHYWDAVMPSYSKLSAMTFTWKSTNCYWQMGILF